MALGRPKVALILTDDERVRLDSLAHRSRTAPHLARRARIILACAEGHDNKAVAKRLRMSQTTVCKWRGRFVRERLDGLYDEPRPGAPRQISDEQIEQVIVRTLEETPRGETHWSSRGMAKASGLGRTTIQQIWRAFGLAAASDRDVQAVDRPAADREGPRHRRAVHASARARSRVLRRREGADSGVGPHATRVADAAWAARASHARLPAAWHDDVVRRAQREDQ